MKKIPIETDLGVLRGRDCIYFSKAEQDEMDNLTFTGDINGALVDKHRNEKDWFPYQLTFRRVLACFSCELDTYENLAGSGCLAGSSFDLIEDSAWLRSLPMRSDFDKSQYKHFRLLTYDVVYDIVAVSHQMNIRV